MNTARLTGECGDDGREDCVKVVREQFPASQNAINIKCVDDDDDPSQSNCNFEFVCGSRRLISAICAFIWIKLLSFHVVKSFIFT